MKTAVLLFLAGCLNFTSIAQNLVPNGDFEQYAACPSCITGTIIRNDSCGFGYSSNYSFFPTVKAWTRPLEKATPDYFNGCAVNGHVDVPANFFGGQVAHSGTAYAGIYAFASRYYNLDPGADYRELIMVKLLHPMQKDSVYCVSFFVSPCKYGGPASNEIAVNEVGANFSESMLNSTTATSYALPYSICNDTINHLADENLWYEIRGKYKARGGEEWMNIGCFNHGRFPAYSILSNDGVKSTRGWISYMYIDDVTVVPFAHIAHRHDTAFCRRTVSEITLTSSDANASYLWSDGSTASTMRSGNPGVYWCTATKDCSVTTDTFFVSVSDYNATYLFDTVICQFVGNAKLNLPDTNFLWYVDTLAVGSRIQPEINTSAEGQILLYAVDTSRPCYRQTHIYKVSVIAPPASTGDRVIELCKNAFDTILIGGQLAPFTHCLWSTSQREDRSSIFVKEEGQYERIAFNVCGTAIDTFTVKFLSCDECALFPTAFTPNNDGRNDLYRPIVRCKINNYLIRIFNRWGECVFVSYDPQYAWDGTKNGTSLPVGTYMFMSSYADDLTGKNFFVKGEISLLR